MTTEQNIYAEVRNSLKSYDESGLIDPISLKVWLHSEIKRFGTNLTTDTDDIIQVKNGKAILPKDFWSLNEVWEYDLSHYCMEDNNPRVLQAANQHHLIQERCDCSNSNGYMKEEVYYKEQSIQVYYKNPKRLRIAPGFNRRAVHKDCINLPNRVQKKYKNTIRLQENTLQTEFDNGYLYIIYKAMPMDDDGNFIIPETQHDRLSEHLQTFLEYKVLRGLWLNNDDPNLVNKIQLLQQEVQDSFTLAMSELKAAVMNPSVWKSILNNNRRRHRRFEQLMPRLTF